jgi:hypothetical protein
MIQESAHVHCNRYSFNKWSEVQQSKICPNVSAAFTSWLGSAKIKQSDLEKYAGHRTEPTMNV